MSSVFEWPHTVLPAEIDELGHANNQVYIGWLNQAAIAHSSAAGWTMERYFQLGEGWVVRRHEIEYLRPAAPHTQIVVRTWIRSFDKASSWRCYAVLAHDQMVLAKGQTLWAWINYKTGRLGRIPANFISAFTVVPETVF